LQEVIRLNEWNIFLMNRPKSKQRPWSIKSQQLRRSRADPETNFITHRDGRKRAKHSGRKIHYANSAKEKVFIIPSEVTDHKIPKNVCKDPWDKSNWEALCKRHNLAKGAQDKKHFKK